MGLSTSTVRGEPCVSSSAPGEIAATNRCYHVRSRVLELLMRQYRWSAVVLLTAFYAALLLSIGEAAATPPGSRKVIANLFEWNWTSVASECQNFLGPRQYGYVQISPPQEHVRGEQWWVAYQPVSYLIESRKGTRAQFQSMISTCHNAGVKVIVDAVINHMTGR